MMNNEQDFKNHYLNEHGRLVFKHKTHKNMFLHRDYYWVDSITMLHESNDAGRQYIDSFKFSTYDLSAWELITKEQDEKVKSNYTEIYLNGISKK